MKLQRLYLRDYKVLRDLDINFSPITEQAIAFAPRPSYRLDFLVGKNGTGKSTVLKILFDLMLRLERPVQTAIPYFFELEYEIGTNIQKHRVKISNLPDKDNTDEISSVGIPKLFINDKLAEQLDTNDFLPKAIVAFTTGSEDEWKSLEPEKKHTEESQTSVSESLGSLQELSNQKKLEILTERSIRELPRNRTSLNLENRENEKEEITRRCLFISSERLPLTILCGLLTDLAQTPQNQRLTKVLEEISVKAIAGFSLKFRKTQDLAYVGDWEDVEKLAIIASHKLRQGTDYLLVFNLTTEENSIAQRIIDTFSDGLELFKKLAKLAHVDDSGQSVLREINIFLERSFSEHPETKSEEEKPPLHLLEWLSDGERSFLARMCLFTLLGTTEALILLDEPEVHFNDYWKRQIVHFLDRTLKERNSHVLITTHSSITLTDVIREDIIVLDRNANYTSSAFNPGLRTFGADPSDIMVHVFGAPHPAGASSVHRIEQELDNSLNRSPSERREVLTELLNKVVAQGYWSYLIRKELQAIEQ